MCRSNLNMNFGGLVGIIILYIVNFFQNFSQLFASNLKGKGTREGIPSSMGIESTPEQKNKYTLNLTREKASRMFLLSNTEIANPI